MYIIILKEKTFEKKFVLLTIVILTSELVSIKLTNKPLIIPKCSGMKNVPLKQSTRSKLYMSSQRRIITYAGF